MGEAGRAMVAKRFALPVVVARLEELYRRVAEARR
jgi:hypothetical protein